MKKCLTVLLVIAVMFTFSFGSAFAAANNDATTVSDRTAALAKITEAYNKAVSALDQQIAIAKTGTKNPANASDADWAAACQEAYDSVKASLDKQLAEAYQEFGKQEQAAQAAGNGILGYDYNTAAPGTADGYVYFVTAIEKINLSTLSNTYWSGSAFRAIDANSVAYKNVLAKTKELIKNFNIDQFVKDDKVTFNGQTKSSYEWAVIAQSDALAYLDAFKGYNESATIGGSPVTCDVAAVEAVYKIQNEGTLGETHTGSFYEEKAGVHPALSILKTQQTITTDKAKIDYAKSKAISAVKAAIEKQRADELDVQNKIIFAQSVAAKPNQTIIDKANEAIKEINTNYDAMAKVWEYRLTNADYKVEKSGSNEYVNAYYNDALYNDKINTSTSAIGFFSNGVYTPYGMYASDITVAILNPVLSAANAVNITKLISNLEKEAEVLKATIYVDGASALAVDEALKEAVDKAYMTGSATLSVAYSNTVVHYNAHKLLGTACNSGNVAAKAKVTLNGKEYDTVENWTTTGYSKNNEKAVKAIKEDAKAAIKAAKSVEEANQAFLEAYAKYDDVLTVSEQKALFNYNGALYGKDTAAKAELSAYIDYKVSLMGDKKADTNTAAAMKEYFNIDAGTTYVSIADKKDFLAEVVDEASLQAAIAEVKAVVDTLKTKDEMKSEGEALAKEVTAVKRPVTLEQEESVLALYDKVIDYKAYCEMVNYTYGITSSEELLKTDIQRLEDLKLDALNATKKALGDVAKLTLADEEAVKDYVAAQKAYNDLYGANGTYKNALITATDYTAATAYDNKIFDLKVTAATNLIKALPVNPSIAQVSAAQKAVDELGFKGICYIDDEWLMKLSKFTQDANEIAKANVQSLKITASSSAAKGSMTIKWRVAGDTTGVEAFEIWKSTKKSSGFKKSFTTTDGTKRTYKNTKELKKGTRYYYKVRAIAYVDGKKITSDWSNKAYRIAK